MKNLFLYALTVVIWGSTWFAIKFQLNGMPTQVSVAYRFALATLILFVWCWLRRLRLRFSTREHFLLMLLGLTLFSTNYVLFYEAEKHLVSGSVAIIFSLLVLFNILNNWLPFRIETSSPGSGRCDAWSAGDRSDLLAGTACHEFRFGKFFGPRNESRCYFHGAPPC